VAKRELGKHLVSILYLITPEEGDGENKTGQDLSGIGQSTAACSGQPTQRLEEDYQDLNILIT
jgi:hypothetical protein